MKTDRRGFLKLALGAGGASVATLSVSPGVLHASTAGYTFTGSSTSDGPLSFVTEWKSDGGFRQIGPVKYKVEKLHRRYRRTQYKTDTYERLTVVFG